jgi:peptidylprolyl isomerase
MSPLHRLAVSSLAVSGLLALPLGSPAQPAAPSPPAAPAAAAASAPPDPGTMAAVLAASQPSDWRLLDPESTLYLEVAGGRVVIELAPAFAPHYVANVKALVRSGYFDGLAVVRSQDNYVVQWGDPHADEPAKARTLGTAQRSVHAELDRPITADLPFARLADGDVYAPQVGFSLGFPVARDPDAGRTWLAHCYGMVGAGRGDTLDASGAELYVVIGHSPRHLDRNVTLLGRVVQGMELLSPLPRGAGAMGFYTEGQALPSIRTVRVAADIPAAQRLRLEALRTDTPTFQALIEARRNRRESWFVNKAGKIDLCNVPLPVRLEPTQSAASR